MQQLALDWTTSTQHGTGTQKEDKQKEDNLLRHLYQGRTSYCALYAIAILEELDIDHVIKTAKKQTSIIRKRSRYNGRFTQISATYRALGHTFPFSAGPDKGLRRIKKALPAIFEGRGYARLTRRKSSSEGHQICYQDGTVYDSAIREPQTAEVFLATTKYTWIIVKKIK